MPYPGKEQSEEFDFSIISRPTEKALTEYHARAKSDYEQWKKSFLIWLRVEGKKPDRLEGFSESVVRQSSMKADQLMRWNWEENGYTTEITPEDADRIMKELGRHSDYGDSALTSFISTFKRIFKYKNREKGQNFEWECNYATGGDEVTNRDYIKPDEFGSLYEAALGYGTVRHYANCTPEERDRIKAHLAQRFEKPKDDVTPDDFDRANSFKIPSLIAVTLDCGLRPIEITRMTTDMVFPDKGRLRISKENSSKNKENWEPALSNKGSRTLGKWLEERATYEKYDESDAVWLTRAGNPYSSGPLNDVFRDLIEKAGIDPAGRDLTWYSIRHGVATAWANQEDIQDAQEQLRHKNPQTTIGYSHSSTKSRQTQANEKY